MIDGILYKFSIIIKILAILATVGVTHKWSRERKQEDTVDIINVIILLTSAVLFNHPLLLPGLIVIIPTTILFTKLNAYISGRYVNKELIKLQQLNNSLIMQNIEYSKANEDFKEIALKCSGKLDSTKDNISYLFSEMYTEFNGNKDTKSLAELCLRLSKMYEQPTMAWPQTSFDMFSHLDNTRDIKRAIKALTNFRKDYYLGEGHDREIGYYIDILEGVNRYVIGRAKQKK